jgi:16S rRNA (cytosine1402-N4)-methyltransferase
MAKFHEPVFLKEVIEYLAVKRGKKYIDATVGGGGHSKAILKLGGQLLAIDCDPEAIKAAREHLSTACPGASWRLSQGNFKDLAKIAGKYGFEKVDGVLFDLGVSSYQLETPKRGFSFNLPGPLDMRMDPSLQVTAADLVNGLNKGELEELFKKNTDEHFTGCIAQAIVRARRLKPITTCEQLAEIIVRAVGKRGRFARIHPATKVFQALRIVVNDELNNLRQALPQAVEFLNPGGRLAVISFHSGEDRIVKYFLKDAERHGIMRIITKKPVRPTLEEMEANPRSRSAKLRVGEKL